MNAPDFLLALGGTVLPLGALWGLYWLVLRPERCYHYNRWLLLLAPPLAVVLPLLPRPDLPVWLAAPDVPTAGFATVLLPAIGPGPAPAASPAAPAWQTALLALYALGVVLALGRLTWQLVRVQRLRRRFGQVAGPGYTLAYTGGQVPTSSFGSTIFWDDTAALPPAEAAAMLAHEVAHVRQGHSYGLLWLEAWRALLWFNPFAHLLLPALRLTHELLADAAAAPGPVAPAYSALLARLAVRRLAGPGYFALLQPFTFSFTLTRIAMLQKSTPVRRWKQWLALPVLGGLFVVACQTSPALAQVGSPALNNPATPLSPPTLTNVPELQSGGGQQALLWAISKGLTYPSVPAGQQLQGQVVAEFKVGTDGRVREARIVRALAPAYDAAVLAAVDKLPLLKPARQNGRPIEQTLTVPLEFGTQPTRWQPAGSSNLPTP